MTRAFAALLSAAFLAAPPLHAQSAGDAEIAALRAELERLTARLDELEQREAGAAVSDAEPVTEQIPSPAAARNERVRLSGDLRYRHETINDDAFTQRNRQRIRARVGLAADVGDDVTLGFTLATGGDNPVSANQSLGGGFSRKSLGVDRAFFSWNVGERGTLLGGKMANPLFRPGGHPLVFDGDLNPEGLAFSYDAASFFANFVGFWVEERGGGDDSLLLAAQAGYRRDLAGDVTLTAGLGYLDYRNAQGLTPFYDGAAAGNTLDLAGNYLNDYDEVEVFAEASFGLGGRRATVFADYVTNTAVSALDTGYALGIRYGDASDPGTWDLGWAYQDLEADAVIGTFTDSDFAGGGTDGKGHVFEASYVLKERLSFGLTYLLNERGAAAGNERDYKRLQADVSFRY